MLHGYQPTALLPPTPLIETLNWIKKNIFIHPITPKSAKRDFILKQRLFFFCFSLKLFSENNVLCVVLKLFLISFCICTDTIAFKDPQSILTKKKPKKFKININYNEEFRVKGIIKLFTRHIKLKQPRLSLDTSIPPSYYLAVKNNRALVAAKKKKQL